MTVRQLPAKQSPFKAACEVADVSFSIGDETANVRRIAIQLKDALGNDITERAMVSGWLSDDANGDTITASAPTTVAAGTDGSYHVITTGKKFDLLSEADGDIDLDITLSSGAATWYLNILLPTGVIKTSAAIAFAA